VLGYSIRLHHWLRSDDRRFFHDHACDFISIALWGCYANVTPCGRHVVASGMKWRSKATDRHYLEIPPNVNGRKMRPLKYFHKYGVIQTPDYQ
jgi:hypothetical protein